MKKFIYILNICLCCIAIFISSCSLDHRNPHQRVEDKAWEGAKVLIVSHRGANQLAPENTYASAKMAIENRAAYIEVDVRRSKDGVYYNFHDKSLARTTDGTGLISETNSDVIDKLDAGVWFDHKFANERVPRLYEYLKWIKGKTKVYFDVKDADLNELVLMVRELKMENECFFWFSDRSLARKFRVIAPNLSLKLNAYSIEELDSLLETYNPQIIETSVEDLSNEFIEYCHHKGLKIMPWMAGNDWSAYQIAIDKKVDMVNLDNPDVFSNMVKNGVFKGYKLILHLLFPARQFPA